MLYIEMATMTGVRVKYLLETAWDFIIENGYFKDFIEKKDLDLTETETTYFDISDDDYFYLNEIGRIIRND